MNIEKLDTLLRNKLQRVESEVHENELDSIFKGMGLKEKKRKFYPMGWAFSLLIIVAIYFCYNYFKPDGINLNQDMADNRANSDDTPAEKSLSETRTESSEKRESETNTNASSEESSTSLGSTSSVHLESQTAIASSSSANETQSTNTALNSDESQNSIPAGIQEPDQLNPISLDGLNNEDFISLNSKMRYLSPREMKVSISEAFLNPILIPNNALSLSKNKSSVNLLNVLKPEIGAWISPNYSFEKMNIKQEGMDRVHQDYERYSEKFEQPLFSVNAGLSFRFKLLPFLNLSTGIGYFKTGNAYDYNYRINKIPVVDSATQKILAYITKPDSTSKHIQNKGRHVSTYIELPLRFHFNLLTGKRYRIGIEPAYTLQFYTRSKGEYMDAVTLHMRNDRGVKVSSGNMQLGMPFEMDLNQTFGLSLTPYFGRSIKSVAISNLENKTRLYAGMRLAFYYKLYNTSK